MLRDLARFTHFSMLLSNIISFNTAKAQDCYYPDGTPATSDTACDPSQPASPCCGSNNLCLDNGLCLGGGILSRGSCTDSNWGSQCPPYCRTTNPSGGMPITSCSLRNEWTCDVVDGISFGCENNFSIVGGSTIVLRPSQVVRLGYFEAVDVSASTVLQFNSTGGVDSELSSSAAPSSTPAAPADDTSATQTVTDAGDANKKYTAAQMAGVGVGVGIPLLAVLVGAGFMILSLKKQLKKSQSIPAHNYEVLNSDYKPTSYVSPGSTTEMSGASREAAELSAGSHR